MKFTSNPTSAKVREARDPAVRTDNRDVLYAAIWITSLVGFEGLGVAAVRGVRPAYDITAGGVVVTHIVDPLPLPVLQDSSALWSWYIIGLVVLGSAYLACEGLSRLDLSKQFRWRLFGIGAIAAVALPFLPTSDPYAYALYGFEAGSLHVDPWTSHALPPDAWGKALTEMFPEHSSLVRECNYGPTFVFAYGALAWAFGWLPLSSFVLVERSFGALCVAGAAFAFSTIDPGRSEETRRFALFALNPIVLAELVAFAHSESLMIVLLAFAYRAWRRGQLALCAGLVVGAAGVRAVAILALVALFLACFRLRPRDVGRVLICAVTAGAFLVFASLVLFRDVSTGGLPVFSAASSPGILLAITLHFENPFAVGFVAQISVAALLGYALLRRWWMFPDSAALAWLPFPALIVVPTTYAHYVVWASTMRVVTKDRVIRNVVRTATIVAPLFYAVHLNPFAAPGAPMWAYAVVESLFWITIIISYLVAVRGSTGRSSLS